MRFATLLLVLGLFAPGAAFALESYTFTPVSHASVGVAIDEAGFYWIDPVGDAAAYSSGPTATAILVTHIHGDHMDAKRIAALKASETVVIGPPTVVAALGFGQVIKPGETIGIGEVALHAVPAYNITPGRLEFHPKGRDNGYILEAKGKRVYFSGDSEDIPEMRALKNIDHAFVCMNLPFTMTEEQAVSAIKEFKPKVVTPYHYRSKDTGVSDLATFLRLMKDVEGVKVEVMEFYK